MQREVSTGHPFECRLHIDFSTNNHPTQLHAANDIDCCFMATLSWGKPAGPRIMRKLWSNVQPNHSMSFGEQIADLHERTDYPRTKRTDAISRERGIESQLRAEAQRGYRDQEDATDPIVAPQDYDVRQSGRVLELQNSDLWLRPTDLSWHFPILMTIREEPFKNIRKMEGQGGQGPKSSRNRRCTKTMMDRVVPTGRHHLGHGTNQ